MSISAISGNNFLNYNTQSIQAQMQQFRQEFQQLGQDLQSGNLSAAQTDFAALQQVQQSGSTSSTQSNSPIAQEFNQLSQDLKAGNLSAAQQDYATLQQDFQNNATHMHHHHRHGGAGGGESEITQLLQQLGQDLQSGTLSAAQQAYNTLMQGFPLSGQTSGAASAGKVNSVSLSA